MIAEVMVGVALKRPPTIDRLSLVTVEADTETEARLIACQMVLVWPDVVMPVSADIVEILEW